MRLHASRMPALNALRAFEAAARQLNFRLAADELGVTQGAIAQHVRALEADLGLKLFVRQARGLALTDHGRSYAAQLRRAFDLMRDATMALRGGSSRLTISVTPTFASKWLIPRLPTLTMEQPQIELSILATESLASFGTDGVDLAVRQGRPPFGSGLTADLLFEQEVVAVCSPTLLATSEPLSPEDVSHCAFLADAHDLWPEFMERALGLSGVTPAMQFRFNQTSLAIDAAITGQGLAVASRFLVEQDLLAGRLVQAFAATMRGSLGAYVITPRKPRQVRSTEIVRHWLLKQPEIR